jgi:hypothetical protein
MHGCIGYAQRPCACLLALADHLAHVQGCVSTRRSAACARGARRRASSGTMAMDCVSVATTPPTARGCALSARAPARQRRAQQRLRTKLHGGAVRVARLQAAEALVAAHVQRLRGRHRQHRRKAFEQRPPALLRTRSAAVSAPAQR